MRSHRYLNTLSELNYLCYAIRYSRLITGTFWRVTQDNPSANLITQNRPYHDQDTPLTGMLCRDGALRVARPGIMLIHGGAGLDQHAREQARRYAAAGYTVLACDMFGDGVAGDRDRVIGCLTELRDNPPFMVRRAQAGLAELARCPGTDGRVAVVGFCAGGMVALALARSGEPLAGVVAIHGSLATSRPADPGAVRARLLVCHGAMDPYVPASDVMAFADEMKGRRPRRQAQPASTAATRSRQPPDYAAHRERPP